MTGDGCSPSRFSTFTLLPQVGERNVSYARSRGRFTTLGNRKVSISINMLSCCQALETNIGFFTFQFLYYVFKVSCTESVKSSIYARGVRERVLRSGWGEYRFSATPGSRAKTISTSLLFPANFLLFLAKRNLLSV